MSRVLVIEDAPEYAQLIAATLGADGHEVTIAGTGTEGLSAARELGPEVIILDLMLPDVNGVEVCRQLRTFSNAYVLMVTARTGEVDKLIGLAVGADDYLTKPFSTRELSARVTAVLRRPRVPVAAPEILTIGTIEIRPERREVTVAGKPVELTRIEFDLLQALAANPQVVLSRQDLIDRIWGSTWDGDDHLLNVHIGNLRRKIDSPDVQHITTVRGVGYRIADL